MSDLRERPVDGEQRPDSVVDVPGSRARARERIEHLCGAPADSRALRLAVLAELRGQLDVDAHVWVVTDPVTEVGSAPVARVPAGIDLPALITAKYTDRTNRWTALGVADAPAVRTLGETPSTGPWRALLAERGIGDVASVVLRDRLGCWGFLDLWRRAERGPVPAADVAFLAELVPALTAGVRRSLAATFAAPPAAQTREAGPAVVLLDEDLRVAGASPGAEEWLATLLPAAAGTDPVPAGIYNTAAQMLARECGVDDHPAVARVHLTAGYWLTLRAARLAGTRPAAIGVTLEETSPLDRVDLFGRTHGLSPREREVVAALAQGVDTRDLAGLLVITPNTVQDHLKAIFTKTGARSRSALLARAVGAQPPEAGAAGPRTPGPRPPEA